MVAYVFPGQGAQFKGMGKDLYDASALAQALFQKANAILGFDIAEVMFNGTDEDLKKTEVTQPAVFIHSVVSFLVLKQKAPEMVAGHSLGEFSALVANGCLSFEDGLKLVSLRAKAMQKACDVQPSTMAAVLRYQDEKQIEAICAEIKDEVVVPANYNCPGQLVISGSVAGIDLAIEKLKEASVGRALKLQVGGAFHSPLMAPAREELAQAITATTFSAPICPVYQNCNAKASSDAETIKQNLITQLTAPVLWTQLVQQMIADGAKEFIECGPGNVLQGLITKIDASAVTSKL
ncbi:MAG: ACP S-malonyltransferase [Chitinophagales bacterium]|nr:ACP S-malonyltransferase [Chitinophagales bacterium]